MSQRIIYGLACPITGAIHYIGKSTQGLLRPAAHMTSSHSDKIKEWVEDLRLLGYKPDIKVLRNLEDHEDIDYAERYTIQSYLDRGAVLLNQVLITPICLKSELDPMEPVTYSVIPTQISEFVKTRRRLAGLTQEEFAERAGIALTVVRKIEQGHSNVGLSALLTVLQMFGATIKAERGDGLNTPGP